MTVDKKLNPYKTDVILENCSNCGKEISREIIEDSAELKLKLSYLNDKSHTQILAENCS